MQCWQTIISYTLLFFSALNELSNRNGEKIWDRIWFLCLFIILLLLLLLSLTLVIVINQTCVTHPLYDDYVNTPPYNLIVRHNGLNVPISSLLMPKTLPYYVAFDSEIMQKSIILWDYIDRSAAILTFWWYHQIVRTKWWIT